MKSLICIYYVKYKACHVLFLVAGKARVQFCTGHILYIFCVFFEYYSYFICQCLLTKIYKTMIFLDYWVSDIIFSSRTTCQLDYVRTYVLQSIHGAKWLSLFDFTIDAFISSLLLSKMSVIYQ